MGNASIKTIIVPRVFFSKICADGWSDSYKNFLLSIFISLKIIPYHNTILDEIIVKSVSTFWSQRKNRCSCSQEEQIALEISMVLKKY